MLSISDKFSAKINNKLVLHRILMFTHGTIYRRVILILFFFFQLFFIDISKKIKNTNKLTIRITATIQ